MSKPWDTCKNQASSFESLKFTGGEETKSSGSDDRDSHLGCYSEIHGCITDGRLDIYSIQGDCYDLISPIEVNGHTQQFRQPGGDGHRGNERWYSENQDIAVFYIS